MIRKTGKYRILKTADLQPSHEALRETEERYRRIFEDSKDMVYIASADGALVDVNQAGVYLFGYASKVKIANFNNSRGIGKGTYAFNRQENGSSFRIKVSSV